MDLHWPTNAAHFGSTLALLFTRLWNSSSADACDDRDRTLSYLLLSSCDSSSSGLLRRLQVAFGSFQSLSTSTSKLIDTPNSALSTKLSSIPEGRQLIVETDISSPLADLGSFFHLLGLLLCNLHSRRLGSVLWDGNRDVCHPSAVKHTFNIAIPIHDPRTWISFLRTASEIFLQGQSAGILLDAELQQLSDVSASISLVFVPYSRLSLLGHHKCRHLVRQKALDQSKNRSRSIYHRLRGIICRQQRHQGCPHQLEDLPSSTKRLLSDHSCCDHVAADSRRLTSSQPHILTCSSFLSANRETCSPRSSVAKHRQALSALQVEARNLFCTSKA